jgi:hypothetical protein
MMIRQNILERTTPAIRAQAAQELAYLLEAHERPASVSELPTTTNNYWVGKLRQAGDSIADYQVDAVTLSPDVIWREAVKDAMTIQLTPAQRVVAAFQAFDFLTSTSKEK